ncbi:MAG: GTP-binding protein [Gemmatimonadaceae bacterium]|nr:GTP-binding protein [Gemmatimonadaceae bacterium]
MRLIAVFCLTALALPACGKDKDPATKDGATGAATGSPATADSAEGPVAPAAKRVARPDSMRALYVNAWASGSHTRMDELIRVADATEVNAFIIDIKESDTFLSYDSTAIPLAKEIGADQRPATKWLHTLIDTLNAHGIYSVARIVVFKDRMLAEKKPEMAIRHVNGGLWRDKKGGAWVNPYDHKVWDYNIAIAKEALDKGFSEVQWDYVRFPDVTNTMRATMVYPGANGKTRQDNIGEFIRYSKVQLASYNVPVTADVFGLVTHDVADVQIGQHWETVITAADAVLPMVYPSHYANGHYGFARPGAVPYNLIRVALTDAVVRTKFVADSAKVPVGEIRPWLEAMSIRGLSYGAREVRQQIQATYDAGLKSWALWNPGSKYAEFAGALRPANGGKSPIEQSGWVTPTWTPSPSLLSQVTQIREARLRPPAAPAVKPGAAPIKPAS